MRLRAPFVAVLASALVVACRPGIEPPVTCVMSSECADPLVCRDNGMCGDPCIVQRECIGGTHCAITNRVGVCFLDQPLNPSTAPCGPMRACDDDTLTCRDMSCWTACTTHDDCVDGSICRRGVCANPSSRGSGYGVRVPCTSATQCEAGEICAGDRGSERVCRRPCSADVDCTDVAAAALCAQIDDATMPAGTMACVIGCDPTRQLGCYNRDRCDTVVAPGPGGMRTFLDCYPPTGMVIAGASCGTTTPAYGTCVASHGCAPAMADMTGDYECRRFCLIDEDCMSATMTCTGPIADGIENAADVSAVFHMCERM